ncbi:MAG: hypothetical protein AAGH99_01085 [Planctomycetota bacterium]
MEIGEGNFRYRWHEDWAKIPDTPSGRNNGRTHGVGVLRDGRIVVFAQAVPAVLFYDERGTLVDSWGDRFVGAHGLQVTQEGEQEVLWLVDQASCEVVKVDLQGNTLLRLDPPPADDRPDGRYTPTWADQHPVTGDVWVGDGYGGSAVYRYSADGTYLGQWLGDEADGAGRFDGPHGLAIHPDGDIYLTDRCNHRVCVYDPKGRLLRHSDTACHSPCSFAFFGDQIAVAELFGAVSILDKELNLLTRLGVNPNLVPPADWETQTKWTRSPWAGEVGWPNVDRATHIRPGVFNSPHGIAAAPNGDLYVGEWIVGGRITKLEKI